MAHDPNIEQLRATLNTAGWAYIEATLQQNLVGLTDLLVSPKREPGVSDDFLRGQIVMLKLILVQFKQRVAEFDMAQMRANMAAKEAEPIGSPYSKHIADPEINSQ